MHIKTAFSIKDLENLSGIKAHTIRIWEKRYNLLKPERSETNIRTYTIEHLQKLLNVASLIDHGLKISRISQLSDDQLIVKVRELSMVDMNVMKPLGSFKLAMLNFDRLSFERAYSHLLRQRSFREIFLEVFIQLLDEIGLLWQTKTITPAQEHFISNLIKQKLLINIEQIQNEVIPGTKKFVLFLPMNEIHELGLLFLHYELLLRGYDSIYLGASVPIDNLLDVQDKYRDLTYISYFTVEPSTDELPGYLNDFYQKILALTNEELVLFGRNTQSIQSSDLTPQIQIYPNIKAFLEKI